MSPRPPPKISLRHDWTEKLGSKVDRQPEGEVARQAKTTLKYVMKPIRLNDDEILRNRMEESIAVHDVSS